MMRGINEAQSQVRQLINGMAKRPNEIHLALSPTCLLAD